MDISKDSKEVKNVCSNVASKVRDIVFRCFCPNHNIKKEHTKYCNSVTNWIMNVNNSINAASIWSPQKIEQLAANNNCWNDNENGDYSESNFDMQWMFKAVLFQIDFNILCRIGHNCYKNSKSGIWQNIWVFFSYKVDGVVTNWEQMMLARVRYFKNSFPLNVGLYCLSNSALGNCIVCFRCTYFVSQKLDFLLYPRLRMLRD